MNLWFLSNEDLCIVDYYEFLFQDAKLAIR
jgi:hypothetical protein